MPTKHLIVALLGTALLALPAGAAETNKAGQPASATGEWQTSKLIHMNVYNNNNEKIGDIKELMTDNSGKIERVVIGVGGFLGMGEHDVAVKFGELKWVNAPVSNTTASNANTTKNNPVTTGTASNTSTTSNRTYPDHAVLNATKDQLKAMPEFKYNK
jgi:sporulation protein YlmC with PRC-barrel domain